MQRAAKETEASVTALQLQAGAESQEFSAESPVLRPRPKFTEAGVWRQRRMAIAATDIPLHSGKGKVGRALCFSLTSWTAPPRGSPLEMSSQRFVSQRILKVYKTNYPIMSSYSHYGIYSECLNIVRTRL